MNSEYQEMYGTMVPHVHVGNGEWVPTESDDIQFLDISEDFQGYDLMTFMHEGKEKQSRIWTRPC